MRFNIDFRLLDVSLELSALNSQFELIKKQIALLNDEAKNSLEKLRKNEKLTPEDPEWDMYRQEYDHKVEFLYPRFFWNSFVVSLYAVLETSIIEISRLIQNSQNQGISINELRGGFLERAKKYYNNVIKFELCNDSYKWQQIKILSEIRHAIAHSNGRLEMLHEKSKKRIQDLEKQSLGISSNYEYIILDCEFVEKNLLNVSDLLNSLVDRYKEWDTKQKSV
jgi:hypothetical protein